MRICHRYCDSVFISFWLLDKLNFCFFRGKIFFNVCTFFQSHCIWPQLFPLRSRATCVHSCLPPPSQCATSSNRVENLPYACLRTGMLFGSCSWGYTETFIPRYLSFPFQSLAANGFSSLRDVIPPTSEIGHRLKQLTDLSGKVLRWRRHRGVMSVDLLTLESDVGQRFSRRRLGDQRLGHLRHPTPPRRNNKDGHRQFHGVSRHRRISALRKSKWSSLHVKRSASFGAPLNARGFICKWKCRRETRLM